MLGQHKESSVAYWQHLDMACPQHAPTNVVINPNTSHDTTEVNVMVMVEKLPPSSLTYVITQTWSPCFARTSLTCKTIAFLEVSTISKKPLVTCIITKCGCSSLIPVH